METNTHTTPTTPPPPDERASTPYITLEEHLKLQRGIATDATNLQITYETRRAAYLSALKEMNARLDQLDHDFITAPERIALATARIEQVVGLIKERGTPIIKSARQLEQLLTRRNEVLAALASLNTELNLSEDDLNEIEVGDVDDAPSSDVHAIELETGLNLDDIPSSEGDA